MIHVSIHRQKCCELKGCRDLNTDTSHEACVLRFFLTLPIAGHRELFLRTLNMESSPIPHHEARSICSALKAFADADLGQYARNGNSARNPLLPQTYTLPVQCHQLVDGFVLLIPVHLSIIPSPNYHWLLSPII